MKDDPTLVLVAQLTDIREEEVVIGMELTMVPMRIKQLMNGTDVVSYCFRPKDSAKATGGEGRRRQ